VESERLLQCKLDIDVPGTKGKVRRFSLLALSCLHYLFLPNQIMDSFRTFGVSGDTKDVIAVHIAEQVSPEPREVLSLVRLVVEGSLQDDGLHALNYWKETIDTTTEKVGSPVDWDLVRRAYKLEGFTDPRKVENLVTSLVAMKSVAA
jgi:hypothetical protein